jgi:predicted tellurium resistance membrane protein TerC
MDWMFNAETWIALLTLTALEIVLGIDNIILLSVLSSRLPVRHQPRARIIGLALAMIARLALLLVITTIMKLTTPLFVLFGQSISYRNLILLAGGLFLLCKSTFEIHLRIEEHNEPEHRRPRAGFLNIILQIVALDVIFSIDSVVTAVGMVTSFWIMATAIILAVIIMMLSSGAISRYIHKHPTIKMLAFSYLLLIGLALITDGIGQHIPKGYLYFAMLFSFCVEILNIRVRKKQRKNA